MATGKVSYITGSSRRRDVQSGVPDGASNGPFYKMKTMLSSSPLLTTLLRRCSPPRSLSLPDPTSLDWVTLSFTAPELAMTPETKALRLTRPFHISRWTGLTSRQNWWLWRVTLLQPNYRYQHSLLALLQSSSSSSSTSSPVMGSTGSRAAEFLGKQQWTGKICNKLQETYRRRPRRSQARYFSTVPWTAIMSSCRGPSRPSRIPSQKSIELRVQPKSAGR